MKPPGGGSASKNSPVRASNGCMWPFSGGGTRLGALITRPSGSSFSNTRKPVSYTHLLCLESVEFWGNGTERLHERLRYDRDEGGWKHRYLQP